MPVLGKTFFILATGLYSKWLAESFRKSDRVWSSGRRAVDPLHPEELQKAELHVAEVGDLTF